MPLDDDFDDVDIEYDVNMLFLSMTTLQDKRSETFDKIARTIEKFKNGDISDVQMETKVGVMSRFTEYLKIQIVDTRQEILEQIHDLDIFNDGGRFLTMAADSPI